MLNEQKQFLESLHEATSRGLIQWLIVRDEQRDPNEDRAIFAADVAGSTVEIELISFPVASGGTYERIVARVKGHGGYFHACIGTQAYDLVESILGMSHRDGDVGRAASISNLTKATTRLRNWIESQS